MLTLTLPARYRTAEQGYLALPRLWDNLRKEYQREYKGWLYMAFVEGQQRRGGMPHFHVVSNRAPTCPPGKRGGITKHNLHGWGLRQGFGYEIDMQPIQSALAGAYVAKYATKATPCIPRGFRRVRVSQHWAVLLDRDLPPLIMPMRGEKLPEFLVRVADVSGQDVEDLYKSWTEGREQMYNERQEVVIFTTT